MFIFARRVIGAILIFFCSGGIIQLPRSIGVALNEEDPILFGGALLTTAFFMLILICGIRLCNKSNGNSFNVRNYLVPQKGWNYIAMLIGVIYGVYQ